LSWLISVLSGCGFTWEPAFDEAIDPATIASVAIAESNDALTFARFDSGDRRRVLLVSKYSANRIEGIDLGGALGQEIADPIDAFHRHGYDGLRALTVDGAPETRVTVAASDLVIPVDLGDRHIAAGTNFPEHADDAGVEDGPFLFAKLVVPTEPYAAVPAGDGLLDYEVELAWVTIEPLTQGSSPRHMGVILCNDYTDRETLMRHVDAYDVASGKGFTTGKSFPGFLPVGNLFVIPRDFRSFADNTQLQLFVNHRLRQRSPASAMVWDFDEIVRQTWARRDRKWEHRGSPISLPGSDGTIPTRTLILAGTPHGTVFDGIRSSQMAAGVFAWLFGGWSKPLPAHVVDAYIGDARRAGIYLQPGDRVVIHVDRLGVINNVVEGASD
jgi:2-keto-4-pentenoate hydratase/2-oxohepta-3-ene-1,7-dioic acid hydratase in catechol pathway